MSVELVIVDEFIELAEIVEKAPISEGKVLEEHLGVDPTWFRADGFDAGDRTPVEGDNDGVAFEDAIKDRPGFVAKFTGADCGRVRGEGHDDVVAHVRHRAIVVDRPSLRLRTVPRSNC